MAYTPSLFSVAAGGCPRAVHHALEQSRRRRKGLPPLPESMSTAAHDGTIFARILEVLQTVPAGERDKAIPKLLEETAASAEVGDSVWRWFYSFVPTGRLLAAEQGIAVAGDLSTLMPFGDPKAWARCIPDRIDLEEGEETATVVYTDWKRGWSGWKTIQAELGALCIDAWLAVHHDPIAEVPVTEIRAQVWSPAVGGLTAVSVWSRTAEAMDGLKARVRQHARVTAALAARPAAEEQLGDGCRWCPIRGGCASFQALPGESAGAPTTQEEAEAMARRYVALRHATAEIEPLVRAWMEETGGKLDASGATLEMGATRDTKWDSAAVYRELLSGMESRLGDAADPDQRGDILNEIAMLIASRVKISRGAAESVAKKICHRDKDGQEALLERWTQTTRFTPRLKIVRSEEDETERGSHGEA